ncbi:MAG: hypothetical protein ABIZ34_06475 [Candidatus Limnocylindrales bacterium]
MTQINMPHVNLPEIDLHKVDLSRFELPKMELPKMELPKVDLSKVEMPDLSVPSQKIGDVFNQAATMVGLRRRQPQRSRLPLAVTAAVVGTVAGVVILSNAMIRDRIRAAIDTVRDRISTMRSGNEDQGLLGDGEPVGASASATSPMAASPYTNGVAGEASAYATGMGANETTDTRDEAGNPA